MPSRPEPLLGELLLRHRLVSPPQLEEALQKQRGTPKHLGEILVEMGAISEADLASQPTLSRWERELAWNFIVGDWNGQPPASASSPITSTRSRPAASHTSRSPTACASPRSPSAPVNPPEQGNRTRCEKRG